jgi:hypothetical protein
VVKTKKSGRRGKDVTAVVAAGSVDQPRAAGREDGLAGLAGGWRGSDALAKELASLKRSRPRRVVRLR